GNRRCTRKEPPRRAAPLDWLHERSLLRQAVADVGEHVVHLLSDYLQDDDDDDGDQDQDERILNHALTFLILMDLPCHEFAKTNVQVAEHHYLFHLLLRLDRVI